MPHMKIPTYTVRVGPHTGRVLTPWRDDDGFYVASRHNRKERYVKTRSFDMWLWLLSKGLRGRFAADGIAPYLVHPDSGALGETRTLTPEGTGT
jgi:hypothetical protein